MIMIKNLSPTDTKTLETKDSVAHEVPYEVLEHIFELITPPSYLLDHSLSCGPHGAFAVNLRLKKSIVLVCKKWYRIGIARLYENVTIRRCGQIDALYYTLLMAPTLGSFVKRLRIDALIVKGYETDCGDRLPFIFASCPKVIDIDIRPSWEMHKAFPSTYMGHVELPPSVRHYKCAVFQFSEFCWEQHWQITPNAFSKLTSLTINVLERRITLPHGQLEFPSLETLVLHLHGELPAHSFKVCWTESLVLPSLTALNFVSPLWQSNLLYRSHLIPFLYPLFDKHGSQLKYFQFCHRHSLRQLLHLQTLLKMSPALEHLSCGIAGPQSGVIPFSQLLVEDPFELISNLSHCQIKWLDIYHLSPTFDTDDRHGLVKRLRSNDKFPKLQGVRFLRANGETFDWDKQLPHILSDPVFFNEDFEMNYPGVRVTYSDGVLSQEIPDERILRHVEDYDDDSEWEDSEGTSSGDVSESEEEDAEEKEAGIDIAEALLELSIIDKIGDDDAEFLSDTEVCSDGSFDDDD